MARTISEIYDSLITAKQAQPDLTTLEPIVDSSNDLKNDLSSGSVVAVWRLWLWIVAVCTHTIELLIDKHSVEVEQYVATREWGTLAFLQQKAKEFQFGDVLTFNGSQFVYNTINPTAQIAERVAVVISGQQIQFKVAKLDTNGLPEPLDPAEKLSFETYIDNMVYAGTQFVVISELPDSIKLDMEIVFDPMVLASDGSMVADPTTFPVIDAINEFISNLPFNGVLNLTALTDHVQGVDGVVDPVLNLASGKYGALPYAQIDKNYIPFAGHAILDEPNSSIIYSS